MLQKPPTERSTDGKRIELHGIDYFQLTDGRIVRTRHVEDWVGVLMALGAFGS
jgi:hypothetical protein